MTVLDFILVEADYVIETRHKNDVSTTETEPQIIIYVHHEKKTVFPNHGDGDGPDRITLCTISHA